MSDLLDENVVARIRELPDRPGIYVYRGSAGEALYVGKAKSLRKRGASYLRDQWDARIRTMLSEAVELEWVVTDTEAEALLIENNWIKRSRPRYNVLLRDDKTYPYLKLTKEPWPKLVFTRRIRDDGATYFGPFLPGGRARRAIKLVQKLFGVRVCRIPIDGQLSRPCLYWDMKRCLGPCVEGLTTAAAYRDAVEQATWFLQGRTDTLRRKLAAEMANAAEALEFERAAVLRDLASEIEALEGPQKLESLRGEDVDVFGVHVAGGNAAVVVLVMRDGKILDRRELFWEGAGAIAEDRLLSEVLPQFYDRTTFVPRELHLPFPIEGQEALAQWLEERLGRRVYVLLPARGPKAQRVELATKNARQAHARRFRGEKLWSGSVEALARHLELDGAPRRIEGFDISHLQGGETVASMVVWEEGRMLKSDYRSFSIRDMTGPDDFASLNQAVRRRYARVLEETGVMPDLILIDGGRGQLNAALAALTELGAEETPIVALAKQEEELYSPAWPEPLRLTRRDPGLQLLQMVRDESHRFALSRSRQQRTRLALGSRLDAIPGVGPKRRRELLRRFGSVKGVSAASAEELAAVVGVRLATRIREFFVASSGADAAPTVPVPPVLTSDPPVLPSDDR